MCYVPYDSKNGARREYDPEAAKYDPISKDMAKALIDIMYPEYDIWVNNDRGDVDIRLRHKADSRHDFNIEVQMTCLWNKLEYHNEYGHILIYGRKNHYLDDRDYVWTFNLPFSAYAEIRVADFRKIEDRAKNYRDLGDVFSMVMEDEKPGLISINPKEKAWETPLKYFTFHRIDDSIRHNVVEKYKHLPDIEKFYKMQHEPYGRKYKYHYERKFS
jgi:hypothetical protein